MDIADIWTTHIKRLVDEEAALVNGKKRSGYRAMAEKTRFGEEYVYQICTDRKKPGKDFAAAVGRAYANGRDPGWINTEGPVPAHPTPKENAERTHPDLARLTAYFLELGPEEQTVVMNDLHARAARAVGARALQEATGYAAPTPASTHSYSPEATRLAEYFDHLSPEVRKRAFAQAEAAMVKAEQGYGAPRADAPAAPVSTKSPAVRS